MFERKGMRHINEILNEVLDHIDEQQEKAMTDVDNAGSDLGGENEVAAAFEIIKQAMIDDEPGEPGSYAHTWHCNIAMMCVDAMRQFGVIDRASSIDEVYDVANDAASRFMKLAFDVDTQA